MATLRAGTVPRTNRWWGVHASLVHISLQLASLPLFGVVAAAQDSVDEAAITRFACRGRSPCRVAQVRHGGVDSDGAPLQVVTLALFGADHPHADGSAAIGDTPCAPFEEVLISRQSEGTWRAHPLVAYCNDGYGAAGVGEDWTAVASGRFTFTTSGGSAWRWAQTTTLRLAPLSILETSSEGFWNIGTNRVSSRFSLEPLGGSGEWFAPRCDADGNVPEESTFAVDGEPRDALLVRWVAIPSVVLPSGFDEGAWRRASLEACSVQVDGEQGFLRAGGADPADATFRVLASLDRALYVEIRDDVYTPPRARVHDRLRVLLAPERPDYGLHCVPRDAVGALSEYRIDLAEDRASTVVRGRAGSVSVDREDRRDGSVRLRLRLPIAAHRVSVVYEDSDDGTHIERRIATSTVRDGDALSLGALGTLGGLRCDLEQGALVPRVPEIARNSTPVLE